MKLDKKMLDSIASLPDDKLWQMLCLIASVSGVRLPKEKPDAATIDGLRGAARSMSDADLARAAEILENYKKSKEAR